MSEELRYHLEELVVERSFEVDYQRARAEYYKKKYKEQRKIVEELEKQRDLLLERCKIEKT